MLRMNERCLRPPLGRLSLSLGVDKHGQLSLFPMLHQLPAEIALQIISSLPLYSLYSTTLVSRDWNALMTINEPSVYRNAALLHRFIDGDQLASGADSIAIDWKAYCPLNSYVSTQLLLINSSARQETT